MTRSNNSVSDVSDSEDNGGGFIVDDPDLKKKRGSRKRSRQAVNYKEESDAGSEVEEGPSRTRPKRNGRSSKRNSAVKAAKSLKTLDDDYDEYNDARDADFRNDSAPEESDDEVIIFRENGTIQKGSQIVDISDESELSNLSDVPLSSRSPPVAAKKKKPVRKTKPKKKVKVPYFTRVTNKLYTFHPDLKDVFPQLAETIRTTAPEKAEQPEGMAVKLLPFQLEGLNWLIKQEESKWQGGVLADEMGMGKTIQTISLFMQDMTKRPNLVVAPTVALMQWKSEIEQHSGGRLKVGLFHGANRSSNVADLMEYDVLLTTYSVLESVYRKQMYGFRRKHGIVKEKSALHSIPFYRVVLDEAHNIKDRNSGTSKAANVLNTKKRWCLSGTPLQNRIGEMYSLIRYMNLFPFCEYFCTKCTCRSTDWKFTDRSHCDQCGHTPMLHTNFFNHFLLKNIQKYGIADEGLQSFEYIRLLLGNIMLRRTKVERADDLGLPPRIVEIKRYYFNEEEKDLYTSLYSDSKRQFNDYVAEGVVLNNYANIFTLITRMRQLADHPDLVLRRHIEGAVSAENNIVCQLCDDEAEEPIESKCHHKFCRLCISEYVESFDDEDSSKALECPVCHIGLSIDLSQPALEVDEAVVKKGSIINRIRMDGEWRSSTKIEALVESLYKLRSDRQTIKSIVFSQFTSMLDLIEWRLKRAGFETVKLQGSMSPIQRESTIKHFMENPQVEVFLVSLKAGGVALNLCEASQVFIMDPWWNPSVEWQSGDRVHRIGQHRPVKITRFCIEDSIEARIIELQDKKANMINATINHDDAAVNKLTPDDLQFLFMN